MVTAQQSRQALILLSDAAKEQASEVVSALRGAADRKREQAFATFPGLIDYFAVGASALAADFYEEERDGANPSSPFLVVPVIPDRSEKVGNAIAWATKPFYEREARVADMLEAEVERRFQVIVDSEVKRPYADTIQSNRKRDPDAVGWKRVASGAGCGFCRMLAAKGAVYRKDTAYFAAHDNCTCTCAPVFKGGEVGPEASVIQYMATKRRRTPAENAKVREWVRYYEGR